MKWSSFSNLSYPFYYAHSCIWLMKSQPCLWSRPSSRAHERLNVITIADVNMWISMVISHRKCCIMRFCVSLLQVSMCISISNCFSDNVSFWRVMSYLYDPDSNDSAVRQRTPRPWQWAGIRRCSASVPPACPIRTWPVQTSAATLPRDAGAPPTQLTHVCSESWAAACPCPARVTPAATDNGKRQRPLTRITWLERFIGYRRHCVACWRLLGEWINILFNLSTVILPQLSPKVV